jgi:hypothetical protein
MKKSKKVILFSVSTLVIIILLIIGLNCIWNLFSQYFSPIPSGYKDALTKSATEISDKYIDEFPDWEYFLKAKITQNEFYDFINEINLKINDKMKIIQDINLDSTNHNKDSYLKSINLKYKNIEWWDVKNRNEVYYSVDYHKDNPSMISSEEFATYENGYLYLHVITY